MLGMRLTLIILCLGLFCLGCGTTPMSTRAFEERYLGMGEANNLYTYANDMLYQGRYREALAALIAAEQAAYTDSLRSAVRARRFWLQEYIAANEVGELAPPPPVIDGRSNKVADKPIYLDESDPNFILPPPPVPVRPGASSAHPGAAAYAQPELIVKPAHPAAADLYGQPAPLPYGSQGSFKEEELH